VTVCVCRVSLCLKIYRLTVAWLQGAAKTQHMYEERQRRHIHPIDRLYLTSHPCVTTFFYFSIDQNMQHATANPQHQSTPIQSTKLISTTSAPMYLNLPNTHHYINILPTEPPSSIQKKRRYVRLTSRPIPRVPRLVSKPPRIKGLCQPRRAMRLIVIA
jgi:hypothetical protein